MGESLEQVQKLKAYVQETFEGLGYNLEPLYPYVLLRVIPKEQEIILEGGRRLHTPVKQNKTVWEGQVIRTYRSGYVVTKRCEKCGTTAGKRQYRESDLKVGDHVLFAHYVGIPIEQLCYFWKNGEYRLVEEGAIVGALDYPAQTEEKRLRDVLSNCLGNSVPRVNLDRVVEDLMKQATLVFNEQALTRSGV